MCVLTNRVLGV